ncbi:TatD DNase family protein [Entomortierella parvispora]|uniref:TatD DNase family protein n=1 Tax=Entomortierella parvispora TaxID=205924 RepID=A0A9P3H146_9FUNG|nr:TatD DNase family protein [Entomortierella parvispora]
MCGGDGHHLDANEPHYEGQLFPEELFASLTDAHCHIQDDRVNIQKLVQSWSTHPDANTDAEHTDSPNVRPLRTSKVCLMGVQPSKDLGLHDQEPGNNVDSEIADKVSSSLSLIPNKISASSTPVFTVSWNETDTKGDWDLVSKLAHNHPDRFVPCFGIHPWFTHKYRPAEERTGPLLELRGHERATAAATEASPSLSFSSAAVTAVPESGVGREAFLAMSKQLQDHMNKDQDQDEGKEEDANKSNSANTARVESFAAAGKDKENPVPHNPIELSTSDQHRISSFEHYKQVLGLPNSAPENYLQELSTRLPEPRVLELALEELRRKLEEHPNALLGEIGLDRTARVPEPSVNATTAPAATNSGAEKDGQKEAPQKKITLALTSIQHQLDIVREQLKIAASLNRAVSFHCVQAYGHWHDFLIQEGRRLKQIESEQEFHLQMQQIQESHGGTAPLPTSLISPTTGRLSKRGAERLRREAIDAAWERHVASTLQESSDEEDSDEEDGGSQDQSNTFGAAPITEDASSSSLPTSTSAASVLAPPQVYEPILPPRLCMHSYGGSVDMLKAFTRMDHPPEMYFSFSILINGRLQEKKLSELILAVPEDRLLVESDHHSHAEVDPLLIEMVQKIAAVREWSIEQTVQITSRNWQRFVYG